jgi:hypothetical protein
MITWTPLPFGKHKGKTLPQVICSDPSWFLWAVDKDIFYSPLAFEADTLHRRLQGVIAPKKHPDRWVFIYLYELEYSFQGFCLVKKEHNSSLRDNRQSDDLNIDLVHVSHRSEWREFLRCFRTFSLEARR